MKNATRVSILFSLLVPLGLVVHASDAPWVIAQGGLPGQLPGQKPPGQLPGPSSLSSKPATAALPSPGAALPLSPCCSVTAVNKTTGVVTAREKRGGRTIEIKATPAQMQNLRVGQDIFANLETKKASLDGKVICCDLVFAAAAPGPAAPSALPAPTNTRSAEPSKKAGGSNIPKSGRTSTPTDPREVPGRTPAGTPQTPGPTPAPTPSALPTKAAGGVLAVPATGMTAPTPATKPATAALAKPPSCPQAWLASYGGVICRIADPSRPAILLFHGLHQTAETWTKPSSTLYNYNHRHTPPAVGLGTHSGPNAGVYKVGESAKLDVDQLNWFNFLRQRNFTVATWSQPSGGFAPAYASALAAFDQFVKDTAAMNPSNPPPIVLMGHSRGGLLIRKLLKERGNAGGRIRWVITLHTPHHGSEVARTPQKLAEQVTELFSGVQLPPDIKNPLKQLALQLLSPLNKMIDDGSRELAPGSALLKSIESGERPVDGVKYYTFGGVSPTLYRLYTWVFTPMSSVPQFKGLESYFKWEAKPVEIPGVSPILDRVRAIVPEIKLGSGDSLVTDQSARLAYSTHETDNLNHAEVLWDRAVQNKVATILSGKAGGSPHILTPKL